MNNLPTKKYGVICADPPLNLFKTRSDKGKDRSPEKHYPVLYYSLHLCVFIVSDIAKPDSVF